MANTNQPSKKENELEDIIVDDHTRNIWQRLQDKKQFKQDMEQARKRRSDPLGDEAMRKAEEEKDCDD